MADENVLEEFLVNVLYNVDERKRKDFNEGLTESFVRAKLLGDALEQMAARGVAAIERYVNGMERLYYVSRNTGASVQNLQALGFAAAQLGGNAEDAVSAVDGLIAKLKETPGTALFVKNVLGVDVNGRDPTAVVLDIVKRLEQMPAYLRLKYEQMIGLSEQQFLVLSNPDVERQMERFRARQDQMGLNPQKAAADAAEFMRAWRDVGGVIDNIASLIMSKIVGGAAPELTHFSDYLAEHGPQIADVIVKILNAIALLLTKIIEFLPHLDELASSFGGWDKVLMAVGAALLGILGTMGLLAAMALPEWLLVMLGVGGAAAIADGISKTHLGMTPEEAESRREGNEKFDESNWNPRNWLPRALGGYGPGESPREKRLANLGPQHSQRGASGTLRKNQGEAYQAAREAGLSDTAARALVANMSGEALALPGNVHWDGTHYAHGIVQWDDVRSARIQREFGKMPQRMSVGEQTKAAIWEMKKYYPRAWTALQGDNPAAMIHSLVHDYEMPADKARAVAERIGYYRGLGDVDKRGAAPAASIHPSPSASAAHGDPPPMPANMPRPEDSPGFTFAPNRPNAYVPSYGGLGAARRALGSGIGAKPSSMSSISSTTNAPQITNHFDIHGAVSPAETARAVEQKQSDVHSELVRNLRNGVG